MKRITMPLIALAVGFATQAHAIPSVNVFFQGADIISASEGAEILSVTADDISISRGLQVDIYSDEKFAGRKQTLVYGEQPSFSFKSFTVSKELAATPPSDYSVSVIQECINLAFEAVLDSGNVNLFADGDATIPGLMNPERKHKQFCPEDGPIDLMKIAEDTLGEDVYGKKVLISVFSKKKVGRFSFYLRGELPKVDGQKGKFITANNGYMGNIGSHRRIITVDNHKGHLTIHRK